MLHEGPVAFAARNEPQLHLFGCKDPDSFITTYAFACCEFHISEHIPSMLYVSVMHRVWMCMLVCDSVRVIVGVLSEAMR
jgi:hypothetical protein